MQQNADYQIVIYSRMEVIKLSKLPKIKSLVVVKILHCICKRSGSCTFVSDFFECFIFLEINLIGDEVGTLKGHTAEVIALHFNDDGNQIITGSFDGTASIWDTRTFRYTYILIKLSIINFSIKNSYYN